MVPYGSDTFKQQEWDPSCTISVVNATRSLIIATHHFTERLRTLSSHIGILMPVIAAINMIKQPTREHADLAVAVKTKAALKYLAPCCRIQLRHL